MNIKLLRKNKAIWTLIRVLYQLGLKVWQFVSRATDLRIDFRKLKCEEIDSSYTSTCTHEETDDEKRSPRERKLVYELGRGRSGLLGLGWQDLAWVPCLGAARAWVRRSPGSAARRSDRFRSGQREEEKEEKKEEGRREKEEEEKERRGRERKRKEEKERDVRLGFLSGYKSRLYSVFGFMRNFLLKPEIYASLKEIKSLSPPYVTYRYYILPSLEKFCP